MDGNWDSGKRKRRKRRWRERLAGVICLLKKEVEGGETVRKKGAGGEKKEEGEGENFASERRGRRGDLLARGGGRRK